MSGTPVTETARQVFSTSTSWPPSLADSPFLAFAVTAGFWVALLLALQWIYAIVDTSHQRQAAWSHPLTLTRWVKVLLLVVLLLITSPRIALLTVWHAMSPAWREWCSLTSWTIYIPAAGLFVGAWWIDNRARRVEEFQLTRSKPPEIDLSIGGPDRFRSFIVLVLILLIAFATTFIRKAPEHHAPATASVSGS